jgi:hypothetical protein
MQDSPDLAPVAVDVDDLKADVLAERFGGQVLPRVRAERRG